MAVPKSKRKQSSIQYIDTMRRLAADIFAFSNRLPKRYAFRLANPLCQHAYECLYHLKAANMTFVNDDESFRKRIGHLDDARTELDHVETLLDVLCTVQQPSGCVVGFCEAITLERQLIGGVKKRDKEAYKRRA